MAEKKSSYLGNLSSLLWWISKYADQVFLHKRHFLSINYDFWDMIWHLNFFFFEKSSRLWLQASLNQLWKCWMQNHAKNRGDKEMFPDFGLPCSALYSVKQQTTVICTDRLCLSNGTAESHIEPPDRERVEKRWGGGGLRDLKRGSSGFSERLHKYIGRGEKHLWRCGHVHIHGSMSMRRVYMIPAWQPLCLIGYLILPVFEDVGRANLTAWFFTCHHTQGAMGNLYKADHPHSQTHPYIHTHAKASIRTHSYTNIILLSCCAEMVL